MTEMDMPIPDNTARMMTGEGPFGSVEMGGMFTMPKVRKDQPRGDYSDPGWYEHPEGTVAWEYTGELEEPARFKSEVSSSSLAPATPTEAVEFDVRKPKRRLG